MCECLVNWNAILEFFRGLEGSETQVEFAQQMANSEFAGEWFASTSHGALVLTPVPDYEEGADFPLIALKERDGKVALEVWTRRSDSNSLSKFLLNKDDAWERLLSFLRSYRRSLDS